MLRCSIALSVTIIEREGAEECIKYEGSVSYTLAKQLLRVAFITLLHCYNTESIEAIHVYFRVILF